MNKKSLLVAAGLVAVLAAILVVLAALFFLKGSIGPTDAAVLAPDDTVLFVNLTNLPRTALRWQGTALAKIAAEPEMKAFLEKPLARAQANPVWNTIRAIYYISLSRAQSDPGGSEAGNILGALKPSNLFVAVANVSPKDADVLVGFRYSGGRKSFDVAVARMRREMSPAGEASPAGKKENEILASRHGARTIYSATHGRWGFVSTSLDQIEAALARVSGAKPGLSENARFTAVKAHLPADPDFLMFVETGKALDALLAFGKTMGAEAIPSQVGKLRATEALGAALKLDGELQRDAVFALRPGGNPGAKLTRKPIRFTGADTAFYCDFLMRFDALSALLAGTKNAAPQNPEIPALADAAASAYGPGCGIIAGWPAGRMAPAPLIAVEVRDPAKAADFLKRALALFPEATVSDDGGTKLYSFPAASNPLAAPTLAQTDGFLLLGLDAGTVAAAAKSSGGTPTLESSPSFAGAVQAYKNAGELFAFVDTRMLFERAYTALRPVIIFGAAVMPGTSDWLDPARLPQTDSVARHLAPIVLSEQRLADGILIESSGPVTMNQMAMAIAAGMVLSRAPAPK